MSALVSASDALVQPAPLRVATPTGWAACAIANFDATLRDHAHCEKKAAAQALALISQYAQCSWLIEPLLGLAQEELRHFRQVFRLLRQRKLTLGGDGGDPYVQQLLRLARHGKLERLIDRLLLSALVESRSAERLLLLAQALDPGELKTFYARLARAEAGHYRLYVRLAERAAPKEVIDVRLGELAEHEGQIMLTQPLLPRIH